VGRRQQPRERFKYRRQVLRAIWRNTYAYADSIPHFNSNGNDDANADGNGYAYTHTYCYRNSDRDGDSNSYTYFYAETLTDAETAVNSQAPSHAAAAALTSIYEKETHCSILSSRPACSRKLSE